MYCIHCGKQLPGDSQFCPYCGKAIKRTNAAGAQQPVSAPIPVPIPVPIPIPAPTTAPVNVATPEPLTAQAQPPEAPTVEEPALEEPTTGEPAVEEPIPEVPNAAEAPDTPQKPEAITAEADHPTGAVKMIAPAQPKKPIRTLPFVLGGIGILVLLAAVLIPISIHNGKQTKYNEGAILLESGNYAQAYEVFAALEDFDDAGSMAAFCREGLQYQNAVSLMQEGNLGQAQAIFEGIPDFMDAVDLAAQCKLAIEYQDALMLYDAKEYADAATAFTAMGDYQDAQALAAACYAYMDHDEAKRLMESGAYEDAFALLSPLDAAMFPDKDDLLLECENIPLYLEAKAALEKGERYSAYRQFSALGDYMDAQALASSCIVPKPSTGESYRNSEYKGSACSLTIKPPTGDGSSTYLKLYAADGSLVSCVFINKGSQATIKLPAGEYRIKAAYGYGEWFGEEEMFGDEGVYQRLKVDTSNETFSLKRNYTYTLTLRSAAGSSGDSVATSKENREDF